MDEILVAVVHMRQNKLKECLEVAKQSYESGEMVLDTASTIVAQLKGMISRLQDEIRHYTSTSPSPQMAIVADAMEIQIQAEDFVANIDSSMATAVASSGQIPERANTSARQLSVKLPKLDLPKFNGEPLRWLEFWDRFVSNIDSQDMADANKLSYLISSLEGKALEAVAGISITNHNYSIAVEALKSRYGSADTLIDAHYTALSNLQRAEYTASSCRHTIDEIERHLRVLEKLGENITGNHLRPIILSKFPEQVLHQYHLMPQQSNIKDKSTPTVRRILLDIVVAMERAQSAPTLTPKGLDTKQEVITTEVLQTKTEYPIQNGANYKQKRNLKRKTENQVNNNIPKKRNRLPCIFCKLGNHNSMDCRKYSDVESRKKQLMDRCHKCLRRNHKTDQCHRKISCFRCGEGHLQLLCPKPKGKEYSMDSEPMMVKCYMTNSFTFLQTAVAQVTNPNNKRNNLKCRLVLDSGSQRSYISTKAASKLQLIPDNEDLLLVYTFGATDPKEMSSPSVDIILETKRDIKKQIRVNIVPHITERLPVSKFDFSMVDLVADDDSTGENIDILIGNDYYMGFMRQGKEKLKNDLYLVDSDFGWLLSGNMENQECTAKQENILTVTTYCHCHYSSCPYFTEPDLPLRNIDIQFLWSLECIGINDSPKATRQDEAVRHFNDTVKYQDNRYQVKWPWIHYPPDLPTNFGLALGRLRSILKRTDAVTTREYDSILKEQLELGIIEIVDREAGKSDHPIHYLPHHMVKQQGKQGRIVYDASAKTTGHKSLNECLYSGPSMLEDLTALLIKFRTKKIALLADVEKAFLQVALQEEDRDVTRFLWTKDIDKALTDENLLCLRFCRVPFGVISSPFLLTATIRYHLSHSDETLLKTIAERCYVDNLVTGANSTQEAKQIFDQTRSAFGELSMNIRDWISNDNQFMEMTPKPLRANQGDNVKVLGLNWNIKEDKLKLKVTPSHFNMDTPVNTKRRVLRALARIYDPCGFVCPLILSMKLIFQNLCEMKVKWDTKLPADLTQSISETLEKLKIITDVEIPRYIGSDTSDTNIRYHLHCFTDASKNAYAAVVYLKATNEEESTVSFMMAKSRVSKTTDKEDLKIPKLELLGFLIGSRLLKYLRQNLDLVVEKEFLWTDSLVILSWMKSDKLLPPFVSNRVKEIKQNHPHTEMCYIHTKSNPADIGTRPELFEEKIKLWFNGPEFLQKDEDCWPENRCYEAHKTFLSVGEGQGGSPGNPDINDEETENTGLEEPMQCEYTELIDIEMHTEDDSAAKATIEIKKLQAQHFPDELNGKKTHLSRNLDLFLDVDGLLRCRGRMSNTTWSYDMKYPILLPKNCEFTNEIIKKTHERNYHVGASHTLNLIRERYWIPQGKPQVQRVIQKCPQCIKHGGGPYKLPTTPALPPERVNYNNPFTYTGVDYLGPLFINTATGKEKRWVALFTCLTIRAIHLEIVKDLSAEECLLAIRRFAANRAIPKKMYSDNATCFKLVAEVIQKPYCIENNIAWKFIPELAPWHGGFYERLVALVKHCLKRTLEKHLLNDSNLLTILKEVEGVLNTRPLTKVGPEIDHVLRPLDFLNLGRCLSMKPSAVEVPIEGTVTKADLIKSWKRGLRIIEEFKKMFSSQYLASLRERYNHTPKQPRVKSYRTPEVGDLVQIKSDQRNRQLWKVGRIDSLIKGNDGECRVAKVNVGDSILTRSIGHLYPLEVDGPSQEIATETEAELTEPPVLSHPVDIEGQEQNTDHQANEPYNQTADEASAPEEMTNTSANEPLPLEVIPVEVEDRSKRAAAVRARDKILEWTRHLLTILN